LGDYSAPCSRDKKRGIQLGERVDRKETRSIGKARKRGWEEKRIFWEPKSRKMEGKRKKGESQSISMLPERKNPETRCGKGTLMRETGVTSEYVTLMEILSLKKAFKDQKGGRRAKSTVRYTERASSRGG